VDAAGLGRGQHDGVDLPLAKELLHRGLCRQVEFSVRGRDDAGVPERSQAPHDGRADHAAVAGDEDGPCVL